MKSELNFHCQYLEAYKYVSTVHTNVQFNQTLQLLNAYSTASKAAIAFGYFQEVFTIEN